MKKSFVLYLDQYASIKRLSDEQSGMLLRAMFEFHLGNNFEITDPVVAMAFSFLEETFKRDNAKYMKICDKNKDNARKRWDKKDTTASDRIKPNAKNADSGSDKIVIEDSEIDKIDNTLIEFQSFWNLYDKKKDHKKCLAKWKLLTKKEKDSIFQCVSSYVQSTKDKQFRKNPHTWLNGKCWNDEAATTKNTTDNYMGDGYHGKSSTDGKDNPVF